MNNFISCMEVARKLHIELFGRFKLQYNGKLITTIDTPRLRQLLAYLLLHRDTQLSRQYLAFKFWPRSTEKQALANLRNLLYQLKNTLPESDRFLIIDSKTIKWNNEANYRLDIQDFHEAIKQTYDIADAELKQNMLKKAIKNYGGPLLPECYKEWIDEHRQRFQQLYKESLEELITLQESNGHLKEAIQHTKKLIQHNSLNESAWRRLMKLYALNNNRAEALQTYYNCLQSLQEEFDIEPAPETKKMHQQLLSSCKAKTGFQSENGNTIQDEIKSGNDQTKQIKSTPSPPKTDSAKHHQLNLGAFSNRKKSEEWQSIFQGWLTAPGNRIMITATFAIIILAVLTVIIWLQSPVAGSNEAQAGGVSKGTPVVVTAFDNLTDQQYLGLAVREGIVSALAQSAHVTVVGQTELRDALRRMELPDTTTITPEVGQEISVRDSYPVIVAGGVRTIGSAYLVSIQIIETATGKTVAHLREKAATEDDIINAAEQVSRHLRERLGESLASIRQSPALPRVITSSLEALKFHAQAREYFHLGEYRKAITLAEQATKLDTAFASAYGLLSAAHNNIGSHESAAHYSDLADHHANRLSKHQRIEDLARNFFDSDRLDSAAYYYELLQELDPDRSTFMLGEVYIRMGKLEKAFQMYSLNLKKRHTMVAHVELIRIARKLGREQLADSVVTLMKERFPGNVKVYINEVANALRFRHLDLADSLSTMMVNHSNREIHAWGAFHKLFLAAIHGKIEQTIASADSLSVEALRYVGPAGLSSFLRMSVASAIAANSPGRALPALRAAEPHLWGRETTWGVADLEVLASGYALAGNIDKAERVLSRIDSLRKANDINSTYGPKVPAVIALMKDKPKEAINHLSTFRSQRFGKFDPLNMWIWAEAHNRLEMPEKAIEAYTNILYSARLGMWYWSFYRGPLWPAAHEQLGYIYLATGDSTEAIRHLSTFVDLWEEADDDLQPRVEKARQALARLR